ncbi:MAG: hypothetical protein JWM86_1082 [Thermoleophilia bacterium]|nr:hypothetical protein [Thermoleophilia bacterium]
MSPKRNRRSSATRVRLALYVLAALASMLVALSLTGSTALADNDNFNPNCPDRQGNGCGDGGGNCGHNEGIGSGGVDNGTGNKKGACGETPAVDACPDETLNPGIQTAGPCKTATVVDACPDETLNPGIQDAGPCKVATVVDACPDETLNPGVQAAGPCKTVPGSSDTLTGGGPTGVDLSGAAVDQDHEPTLGSSAAPGTPADGAEVTVATAGATTAGTSATGAGGDYAVVSAGGSLPVTGAPAWVVAIAGFAAMMLGSLAYRDARRVSRNREIGAAA